MIPDLQASLLCDDVRQEKNGKFLLIGIFDGLAVSKFPSTFLKICIVNRWCCGRGQFIQSTRIIGPDGQTPVITGKDVPIQLVSDKQAATSVEIFINLKFEQEGTYWVEVLLDGQLRMRYPLAIKRVHPPEASAQ
jgi:hypothetical protein